MKRTYIHIHSRQCEYDIKYLWYIYRRTCNGPFVNDIHKQQCYIKTMILINNNAMYWHFYAATYTIYTSGVKISKPQAYVRETKWKWGDNFYNSITIYKLRCIIFMCLCLCVCIYVDVCTTHRLTAPPLRPNMYHSMIWYIYIYIYICIYIWYCVC